MRRPEWRRCSATRAAKKPFDGEASALKPPGDCASASDRRPLHDHESGELEMLDEAFGDDLGHELIGVVDALPPLKAQRERKSGGEVARVGRRQLFQRGRACLDDSRPART
jgi:hypothetical protein